MAKGDQENAVPTHSDKTLIDAHLKHQADCSNFGKSTLSFWSGVQQKAVQFDQSVKQDFITVPNGK